MSATQHEPSTGFTDTDRGKWKSSPRQSSPPPEDTCRTLPEIAEMKSATQHEPSLGLVATAIGPEIPVYSASTRPWEDTLTTEPPLEPLFVLYSPLFVTQKEPSDEFTAKL
jgi:hypothetical protein